MVVPVRSPWGFWGVCLLWILGPVLGCAEKESRYPADFARYQRIDTALETLHKGYVSKDPATVSSLMLPLDQLDRLQVDIQQDFATYAEIKVDFAVERIVIDGNTIEMYVHWQGQWKKTPLDDGLRERGHGMLRWVGVQSILLSSVEGDMPFGMAVRQAAATVPEPPKAATP
jgi:hypothetical protein